MGCVTISMREEHPASRCLHTLHASVMEGNEDLIPVWRDGHCSNRIIHSVAQLSNVFVEDKIMDDVENA